MLRLTDARNLVSTVPQIVFGMTCVSSVIIFNPGALRGPAVRLVRAISLAASCSTLGSLRDHLIDVERIVGVLLELNGSFTLLLEL